MALIAARHPTSWDLRHSRGLGIPTTWVEAGPRPDVAGALAAVALVAFLVRGREPALFACMLFFVAVLELYGTAMGTWQWAAHWPGLHIPQANPPSGVAAGYCVLDALALRLGPRLQRTVMRPFSTRTSYAGCG